ncbi:uncharacterized protein LOC106178346 [Lingula anatina]|uniref:Uncharacterized protein LOC106178346 n=1 Tax=Lingula anatina TaxID=7574 RepID=A0A1S3K334_LINAN|nr:uncharacterized protein LOC106178346 [Lingula anatina]|eukprot:XP_013416937.1 uncharacterized protein LOC106178346 [Lingula anatina]
MSGRHTPPLMLAQRLANAHRDGDSSFFAQLLAARDGGGGEATSEKLNQLEGSVDSLRTYVETLDGQIINIKEDCLNVKEEVQGVRDEVEGISQNMKRESQENEILKLKQDYQELRKDMVEMKVLLEEWKAYGDESFFSETSSQQEMLASGGVPWLATGGCPVPDLLTSKTITGLPGEASWDVSSQQELPLCIPRSAERRFDPREDKYIPETTDQQLRPERTRATDDPTRNKKDILNHGPMTERSKNILVNCRLVLIKDLELDPLIPYLFEDCVLTDLDVEYLDSLSTHHEKICYFLEKILPRKKEKAFWDFRRALLISEPPKKFLADALDKKLSIICSELETEIAQQIAEDMAEARPLRHVQDEIHQKLPQMRNALQEKLCYLDLHAENIRQGSIIMDLKFWNVEHLDNFWAWCQSSHPSPLSAALSDVILTDEVRAMVPSEDLRLSLRTSMDWPTYMDARRRLLRDAAPTVSKYDDVIYDGRRQAQGILTHAPYHFLLTDKELSDATPRDLVRMAFEEGYLDKIPILKEKFPTELRDFSDKDIRLERLRDLIKIMRNNTQMMLSTAVSDQTEVTNQLQDKTREVETLSQRVGNLEMELLQKNEEIARMMQAANLQGASRVQVFEDGDEISKENEQLQHALQEKCNTINIVKSECQDLRDQLKIKDQEINNLRRKKEERTEKIKILEDSVRVADVQIKDQNAKLQFQDDLISKLRKEKEDKEYIALAFETAVEDSCNGREPLTQKQELEFLSCGKTITRLQNEVDYFKGVIERIWQGLAKENLKADTYLVTEIQQILSKNNGVASGYISTDKPGAAMTTNGKKGGSAMPSCGWQHRVDMPPGEQGAVAMPPGGEQGAVAMPPGGEQGAVAMPPGGEQGAVAMPSGDEQAGSSLMDCEQEEDKTDRKAVILPKQHNPRGGLFKRKSSGLDTVFCIDTSGSMTGEAFTQMKAAIIMILDEMKRSHLMYEELEEDVAIVTFGKHGDNTVLTLTNDYEAVRRVLEVLKPEGMTPMTRGLVEAQNELQRHSGSLRVAGRRVRPRILVFTDGIPSDSDTDFGSTDSTTPSVSGTYKVMSALQLYSKNENVSNKARISFIACGTNANKTFMESASQVVDGLCLDAGSTEDMRGLGAYYRRMVLACRFAAPFKTTESMRELCLTSFDTFKPWFQATNTFPLMEEDKTDHELREIYQLLLDMKEEDRRHRDVEGEVDPTLQVSMPIGTRVVRGPDWKWENQDGDGPGTVVGYGKGSWVWVHWDYTDHENIYRYGGPECAYDVWIFEEAKKMDEGKLIDVGVRVKRGPDWRYGDQDGGNGTIGIVVKVEENGKVKVRWPNRKNCIYRFGYDGKFDLTIVEDEVAAGMASGGAPQMDEDSGMTVVWQWKSNGVWLMYPEYVSRQLEQAYKRDRTGSCSVEVQSLRRRINFSSMTDHCSDIDETFEVQRLVMTQEEYEASKE